MHLNDILLGQRKDNMSVSPAFTPPESPNKEHSTLIQQARLSCLLKRRGSEDNHFTYVLELQDGFIYVGRTLNIYQRLMTHLYDWKENGVEWIKLYGPVKRVVEIYADCSKDEETHLTLLWMHRMGWERVRGGPWVKKVIKHMPRDLNRQDWTQFDMRTSARCTYMSRKAIDKIVDMVSCIHKETS